MAKARSTKHEYKSAERYKSNIEQRAGESDLEYYTRLAKQADQRLVRLEKLANEPGFENVRNMPMLPPCVTLKAMAEPVRK